MRDGISECLLSYVTFTKTLRGKIQSSPLLQKSKPRHKKVKELTQEHTARTSLVAQWLRIHMPMQGTRVRALVREDPTCRGATKPVRHIY